MEWLMPVIIMTANQTNLVEMVIALTWLIIHLLATPIEHAEPMFQKAFAKLFLKLEMASCLFSIQNMGLETAQGNHQSARAKEVDGKKFITKIAIKVQWA